MPARIYALAKELNLDSKDLVGIVKKVGITGKGSALASLTDEEAQKVRDHLAGGGDAPPAKQAAPTATLAPVRQEAPVERKPIAIKVGRSSGPKKEAAPEPTPVETPSELPTEPDAGPIAPAPAAETAGPTQKKKGGLASRIASRMGVGRSGSGAGETVAPIRRDPVVAGGGKVRSLDRPTPSGEKKNGDSSKTKRREPRINVKMAALPEVAEPSRPKQVAGEPKAQKPDVKLSRDVIEGHRQGMKAPLEQLKEDTDKKRLAGAKRSGGLSGFTGDKTKRGAAENDEDEKKRKKLAGMAGARADRTRGKSRGRVSFDQGYGGNQHRQYRGGGRKRKGVNTAAPRKDAVVLELPCTIRSFSENAGVPVGKVLATMMGMGMTAGLNINSELDFEAAELIAAELSLTIELKE